MPRAVLATPSSLGAQRTIGAARAGVAFDAAHTRVFAPAVDLASAFGSDAGDLIAGVIARAHDRAVRVIGLALHLALAGLISVAANLTGAFSAARHRPATAVVVAADRASPSTCFTHHVAETAVVVASQITLRADAGDAAGTGAET